MPTTQKVFAFAAMCVGMFIALLDIQIVSASLRDIGGGLSAGADETAWVQTSYLIAEIVVIPLSGWLSRVFSTRWLFCASAIGFTLTSLLCGLAWNIQSMIAFRALQGFLGGSMIPMVFTSAFIFFSGKQKVIAASTIGAIASLAPTLGPVIGGWITEVSSWHWLFYINLVPGIFVAVAVPMLVRIDKPDLSLLRGADYASMAFMAIFLGCLEYTLEEGPRWNWFSDSTIVATAWISAVAALAFVSRSLIVSNPIVDLRALKERNFALGCFFSFVTGIGLFATIYLTPLFLGRVRGYSALDIGLAVFSTGVFQVMSIPLYAFLANRIDLRWILMAGLALFAVSMWDFSPLTHDWGARELLLPQALRGMAQQLAVPPAVTLTLGALAPARLKHASGLFNLMRNLGGAIGIAACATLLNDRTNLHFTRLAEHLNSSNEALNRWLDQVGDNFASLGQSGIEGSTAALRQLWLLTYREAQTQTFSDAFLTIMCCFIVATALVPLMHKVVPPAAPSADAH
ncbi:DHA2 family efflux MFS transporter permease subunit [Pseudomonas kuykendallii]|uniref:DHA2 family efflux MFS transporter permease subunit n=1 Tax=Pseudomonas kuykendallii TaxID=1007099 RepID=UPI0028D0D757|nr:DHA2 family efflux MFS transporter permease subunit [Pseudomonas kuykendallii]